MVSDVVAAKVKRMASISIAGGVGCLGEQVDWSGIAGVRVDLSTPLSLEVDDPFDDFDEDDFDDDFDDDFEEDWEDDLPEDEEFPDTFGGHEDEKKKDDKKKSPFKDDPDFDKS